MFVNDSIELKSKVATWDNLHEVGEMTKSKQLPKNESAKELNKKGVVSLNPLEQPCDMLGMEATEQKKKDTKLNYLCSTL